MAGSLSDYAELKILDHSTGRASWTMPTVYVAAFTAAPTDAGGGTEASGGSYTRPAITFSAAAAGAITNSAAVEFATGWSGTVVAIGLFDATSGGNLIWWMDLTANVVIATTDIFRLAASSVTLNLS